VPMQRPPRYEPKKRGVRIVNGQAWVDLKPIDQAIQLAREQLIEIEKIARDPKKVADAIKSLENLDDTLSEECPQVWFDVFDVIDKV